MNAVVPASANSNALIPTSMEGAMRLAEMMARGRLVPSHLQQQPGDCLMVIEQAMRWGMSPFAVAQSTSVVQGKLMFEGKLVAAAVQSSGILSSRLSYEFSGEGEARQITVKGTIRGETAPRDIVVRLKDAKTSNGMWVKQPDQQLVYHATRAWARRHVPEVMLGVYSPEEMEPPVVSRETFDGVTIDGTAGQPRDTARAIGDDLPESVLPPQPKKRTVGDVLAQIQSELDAATCADDVDAIIASDDVQKALDKFPAEPKKRLDKMINDAIQRFPQIEPDVEGALD